MSTTAKKTLVLGASDNPSRYSFLAVNKLRAFDHPVVGIGRKNTQVGDVQIDTDAKPIENLDTVTLYLNPDNQKKYYDYILALHPHRVIFNPGAENPEFEKLLQNNGIDTLEACTLVLLSTGQF